MSPHLAAFKERFVGFLSIKAAHIIMEKPYIYISK